MWGMRRSRIWAGELGHSFCRGRGHTAFGGFTDVAVSPGFSGIRGFSRDFLLVDFPGREITALW